MSRKKHTLTTISLIILALLAVACNTTDTKTASQSQSAAQETLAPVAPVSTELQGSFPSSFNPGQPLKFEHISLEHGLSQNSVYCILQDSLGILWFGTEDGLNKYDGYTFTYYRNIPGDPHSLSHNHVRVMLEDDDGAIWIGTHGGGLNRFDRKSEQFTHYEDDSILESTGDDFINALFQAQDGTLWVGTSGNGLSQFDPQAQNFTQHYRAPNQLSNNNVLAIYQDRDGALWIGTDGGGLDRFDLISKHFNSYQNIPGDPHSLSSNSVGEIFQDRNGTLWIGTNGGGLNKFDIATEQFTSYQHDPHHLNSLGSNSVGVIFQDREGLLWVGTSSGGLDIWDAANPGHFTHYQHDLSDIHSLSSDKILSIYEDREGLLWIGTHGGGVNKLNRATEPFIHYYARPNDLNSLSNNMIWTIHEDREGYLWVGTGGGGLNRIDRAINKITHYQHILDNPSSLHSDVVRAIAEDKYGNLWLGTEDGGLNKLKRTNGQFTYYAHKDQQDNPVLTLYKDQNNILWIGTAGGGLSWFDLKREQFTNLQLPDSQCVPGYHVRVIYPDSSGAMWIGSFGGGLSKIDWEKNLCTVYRYNPDAPSSLSNNIIMSVYEDSTGTLWVATFGGGLNKFDPETETFTHYRENDGLPNDMVYGILEETSSSPDDEIRLWLSTNQGIARFSPQAETFKIYDVNDGLQSNEFNGGAYYKSNSGEMFFGGINGFNAFYPLDIKPENAYIPPVVLTYLAQGGEEVTLDTSVETVKELVIRWPNNFFEFEFAALSYTRPEKNQYAYMLEGLEKNWIENGNRRFGRYTNLPGGNYVLRLKGSNNDGIWNETGTAIAIKVIPPFWAAWWFRAALILGLAGIVGGFYGIRVKNIRVNSRKLEIEVEERTQELKHRTHESERRQQELEALYRADAELHRLLNLDQVLQTLVDIVVNILQADKSSLMVWDKEHERLVIQAAHGFRPETLAQMSFTPGVGTVGRMVKTGELVIVEDVHADALIAQQFPIAKLEGIRSFMLVPIEVGGEVFGVFSADYLEPRSFGSDERRLFVALAQRAALAIDTAQLYEHQKEAVVLEERNRLARDLHDAVTQTLFSASLIAEALPTSWNKDQSTGKQLLQELQLLTRGALAEMRTLLLELRPAALLETNLGDLMRQLAEAATGSEGIPVAINIKGEICKLPPNVHIALYRIAQEALNNITKHAGANQASVSLSCEQHPSLAEIKIQLGISDDGRGFDINTVSADRMGLCNMRERAQNIDAALTIQSKPGRGTEVIVIWEGKTNE